MRPLHLDSKYQHHGTRVKVKYDTNGEAQVCSTYPTYRAVEVIQITEIKMNLD